MARGLEVALHIDRVVAERRTRLGASGGDRLVEVFLGLGDLHAATTAAGGGLDQHGEADLLGGGESLFLGRDGAVGAGNHRDAGFLHRLLGGDLVAHHLDVVRGRADEGHAMGGHDLGEPGVFRQEPVARVNSLGARDLRRCDDRGDVQVALGRRRRSDADAFVGQANPHGACVALGVDRHRRDTHFLAGPMDPQGDLAAIGDEDFIEHRSYSMTTRGSPNSTGWASSTMISTTLPAFGAGIGFMVFMASTIISV